MGSIHTLALASNPVSTHFEDLPKQTTVIHFMFDAVYFKLYSEERKMQLLLLCADNVRVCFNKSKQ